MENISTIKVIKRNGKKVPFNIAKLTIGIKNAFYNTEFSEEKSDSELNLAANEVVSKVIDKITSEILIEDTITVQNLSELTERVLQESGYLEVYNTYANYNWS